MSAPNAMAPSTSRNSTTAGSCTSPPAGATSYGYDANGALQTGSDGLTLGYNLLGQTTSIDPAGSVGPITMSYDGVTQDRRASKGTQQYSYGYTGLASQYTAGRDCCTNR